MFLLLHTGCWLLCVKSIHQIIMPYLLYQCIMSLVWNYVLYFTYLLILQTTDYETSIFTRIYNFPKIIIVYVCDLFIVLYDNVPMQIAVIFTIMTLVFTLHCVKTPKIHVSFHRCLQAVLPTHSSNAYHVPYIPLWFFYLLYIH